MERDEEMWPGKRLFNPDTGQYVGRYKGQLGSETLLIAPARSGVDHPNETRRVRRRDVRGDR